MSHWYLKKMVFSQIPNILSCLCTKTVRYLSRSAILLFPATLREKKKATTTY